MTLIQSAKFNGLDPQSYLRDLLECMPTARRSDMGELLPHNWKAPARCDGWTVTDQYLLRHSITFAKRLYCG
ncbi:MAG: transposase domain-containing protein [Haliea sp.]|nr:transposase domain-containing protein [Haliea sp.]